MRRICIVTKYLQGVHSCSGGMEAHVNDLIEALKNHKEITLTIITSKHPENKKTEVMDNLKVYYVDKAISRNPASRYRYFKAVKKKLIELDYTNSFDVLHIQSDFGVGFVNGLSPKIPVLTTSHGTALDEFKGSIKAKPLLLPIWAVVLPLYYLTEKRMFNNSNKVISVSDLIKRDIVKQYGIDKNKIITIYNGVDTKQFSKRSTPNSVKLKKKYGRSKIILTLGNIIKQKGYHLLIEALPKILEKEEVKLVIVGDGKYLEELKRLSKKEGVDSNIVFTGKVNRSELTDYYNIADIFAFPTLRGEGLPYVLIEAMSCGLCVVSSPSGGVVDIIEEGKTGKFVKVGNLRRLSETLIKLLKDKKERELLGKNARREVLSKFDVRQMVNKNLDIYKSF
jgi:glycosyltransferase involved in cell wall biosynthesis